MTAVEVLEQNEWIQGEFARDAAGDTCEPGSPKACAFCLAGALYRAYPADGTSGYVKAYNAVQAALASTECYCGSVSVWNDELGRTKEEVIAVLKRAGV